MSIISEYIRSTIKQFEYYKGLGERTFEQLKDDALYWQYHIGTNSIAIIVKHLHGNMCSRWTDFLTSDGEKEGRNRDSEFEDDFKSRAELLAKWDEGWNVLLSTLEALTEDDFKTTVYIRKEPHTVIDAINRQLAHYAYHVGQIVFVGKMTAQQWQSLTIPRGQSRQYNTARGLPPGR